MVVVVLFGAFSFYDLFVLVISSILFGILWGITGHGNLLTDGENILV
jgi:hypothetical protein